MPLPPATPTSVGDQLLAKLFKTKNLPVVIEPDEGMKASESEE